MAYASYASAALHHSTAMQPTSPSVSEAVDMNVDEGLQLLQARGAQELNAIDFGVVVLDNMDARSSSTRQQGACSAE